ncbi:flagellar basal body-associated FliL family protein [Enterococcus lemanii]|uniref:Flagellar protein FliL n=1 Tax=Enterococcus lemanii TaxID=1159752 RepID=A0ABV9MYK5_9ENTE|nr:flagellar basal body-associated FliL family protein [Enterococcus lemanii]MBM7708065.1 flagellar FliL protein [Enterococcus lemanii]
MAKKEKKEKKQAPLEGEEVIVENKQMSLGVILPLILILAVIGSIGGTILTNKFILPPVVVGADTAQNTGSGRITEDQIIVPMEEFLVNLAQGEKGKDQYIRVTLSLLVGGEKDSAEITKNVAVIRDSIVNTLRQKKSEDILGSAEGVANLKSELRDTLNQSYGKTIVGEVFITDFVIQ